MVYRQYQCPDDFEPSVTRWYYEKITFYYMKCCLKVLKLRKNKLQILTYLVTLIIAFNKGSYIILTKPLFKFNKKYSTNRINDWLFNLGFNPNEKEYRQSKCDFVGDTFRQVNMFSSSRFTNLQYRETNSTILYSLSLILNCLTISSEINLKALYMDLYWGSPQGLHTYHLVGASEHLLTL